MGNYASKIQPNRLKFKETFYILKSRWGSWRSATTRFVQTIYHIYSKVREYFRKQEAVIFQPSTECFQIKMSQLQKERRILRAKRCLSRRGLQPKPLRKPSAELVLTAGDDTRLSHLTDSPNLPAPDMQKQYEGPEDKTAENTNNYTLHSPNRSTQTPSISSSVATEAPKDHLSKHHPESAIKIHTAHTESSTSSTAKYITLPTDGSVIPFGKVKEGNTPNGIEVKPQLTTDSNLRCSCLKNHPAAQPKLSIGQDSTHHSPNPSKAKKKHKARIHAKCKTTQNNTMKLHNTTDEKCPVCPQGLLHPFTYDRLCTRTICKNADLPPNVRRWLNVTETTGPAVGAKAKQ